MNSVYALGRVESGKLLLKNQQIFKEEIKTLNGDIILTVSEGRGKRSLQQNKYYHSVVCGLISETTGYTPEEVHNFLKDKFLSNKHQMVIGNEERLIEEATTTKLTTKEFKDYIEKIQRWASEELNVSIPDPNE